MNWFVVLIAFILGFVLGWLYPRKTIGTLKIDHSDPEKDQYQLEISNLDILDKKTEISLRVDNDADLSRE